MKSTAPIQFVTCVHGNEVVPLLALQHLDLQPVIAHPLAVDKGVRFIEKDMNACFALPGKSIEQLQASRVLEKIDRDAFVIDFHTASMPTQPFVIITRLEMLDLARWTGVRNIVYMNYSTKKGHALIDHCNGVSVEVGTHGSFRGFELTQQIVRVLQKRKLHSYRLFEVYGQIDTWTEQENFVAHTQDSELYYPILATKRSDGFFGLKAKVIDEN